MFFRKTSRKKSSNSAPTKPFNFFGLPCELQSEILSYLPIEKLIRKPVSKLFRQRVKQIPEYKFISLGEKQLNEKKECTSQLIQQINRLISLFSEKHPHILSKIENESEIQLNYYSLSAIHRILTNLITQVDQELISPVQLQEQLIDYVTDHESAIEKINNRFALQMLGEDVITIQQIFRMNTKNLNYFFSASGYKAFTQRLITLENLYQLDDDCLKRLLEPKGMKALSQHLITAEEAITLGGAILNIILSTDGIKALEKKVISIPMLIQMKEQINNLVVMKHLISPLGLTALNERLISISDAARLDTGILQSILTETGLQLLRMQLMTLQDMTEIGFARIHMLFMYNIVHMLSNRHITLEEIKTLNPRECRHKLAILELNVCDNKQSRRMN